MCEVCLLWRILMGKANPKGTTITEKPTGFVGLAWRFARVHLTTITPSSHSSIQLTWTMKIQKYVFLLPSAIEVASKRFGIPTLSPHDTFILYSIQYLPMNSNQASIHRHAVKCNFSISEASMSRGVHALHSYGLISLDNGRFALSPLGREYLSAIRRYLLNKRL